MASRAVAMPAPLSAAQCRTGARTSLALLPVALVADVALLPHRRRHALRHRRNAEELADFETDVLAGFVLATQH
jgi:hypothetical protein